MSPSGLWIGACMPGPPRWVGPPGPQPAASGAGRGGAQRSRLDFRKALFGSASAARVPGHSQPG
jgi:hypothetical protein